MHRTSALLLFALAACHPMTPARPLTPPAAPDPCHTFPFPLRDGRTGERLTPASLEVRLRAARAVYAGEQHNSAAAHDVQLALLMALHAQDASVGVAVEMLPASMQGALDAYLAGQDEEGFLKAVDWEKTWGFDFALYRPIFAFCRAHGLHMYALNAPRELSRALRQGGVEGLTPAQRAALPDGYPWPAPEPHRRYLRAIFDQHPPAKGSSDKPVDREARSAAVVDREANFARFYLAQQLWDETMAQGTARALAGAGAPRRLLVLAGTGHVGRHAIPARAARRGVVEHLSVLPVSDGETPTGAEAADVLVDISAAASATAPGPTPAR